MAHPGVSKVQYEDFLIHGGQLRFELDAEEISAGAGFEKFPHIAPLLDTGFELPPTSAIEDPEAGVQLLMHGDWWVRAVIFTYRHGGSVVYRRVSPGRYEATATMPSRR